MTSDIDLQELAQALSYPGIDPRTWFSYALVDRAQDGEQSVKFDPDWGPMVRVVLQPENVVTWCRVAMQTAGPGEGDWHPYVEGDELLVAIPEGSILAVPVVMGRLCNSLDKFPERVAGKETGLNNLAFTRKRTPYIFESSSSILFRSATTGAMFGIDENGNITIRDGESNALQFGANGVAVQDKEGNVQLSLDVEKRKFNVMVGASCMTLDEDSGQVATQGTFKFGTCGVQPGEHLVTLEQLVNILATVLTNVVAAPNGIFPGKPDTGFPNRDAALAAISAALLKIASSNIAPALPGITAALSVQLKPPCTPMGQAMPGVGCVGLLGG